ncbi:hypothetical protein J2848_004137 [Azospirillum lipoferum]|uniref:Uncharacterized protein n=1 Tax=Azospirillum lipoferum TaxID=193 RepID=A0A5A9GHR5_AZOLI|nr:MULTISPECIES: hypothetical protein [Azospirillum]KAA0593971.1 hypothetical protein FZ942_21265 [Azospirillum lipoferum]MCP1612446.1 hypothetical protein [Azospirillum lipoferum]MDW5531770.1 hypothetical protein [Azospirillum sp. NL1]
MTSINIHDAYTQELLALAGGAKINSFLQQVEQDGKLSDFLKEVFIEEIKHWNEYPDYWDEKEDLKALTEKYPTLEMAVDIWISDNSAGAAVVIVGEWIRLLHSYWGLGIEMRDLYGLNVKAIGVALTMVNDDSEDFTSFMSEMSGREL